MAFGDVKSPVLTGAAAAIPGGGITATGAGTPVAIGDLIVAYYSHVAASVFGGTCTDNLGYTYAAQNAGTVSGNTNARAYWVIATAAGTLTTVTIAATADSGDFAAVAAVFTGPFAASPLDATPANATDAATPFVCPSTGTLAQARELIVCGVGMLRGQTDVAATSPNVLIANIASAADNALVSTSTALGSQVVSATTAVAPEFSITAGTINSAVEFTMSFKAGVATSRPSNWPNPGVPTDHRAALSAQSGVWQNVLGTLLAVSVVAAPFNQDNWPNPRGPTNSVENRTWINQVSPNLSGKDRFYGAPGQVPDYSWPNPSPRQSSQQDYLQSTNLGLLAAVALPFAQDYWPNPAGKPPLPAEAAQDVNQVLLTTTGTKPFAQDYWPNPRGYLRSVVDYQQSFSLLLAEPFAQVDWPNPRGYALRQDYQQSVNFGLLATTDAKPFAQGDWSNPRGFGPRQDYQQPTFRGLLATETKPFLQVEWPNPVLRPTYRSTADAPNLTGALLPPFAQIAWPNSALGAVRATQYEWPTLLGLLTTTGVEPFSQNDWPNPRGHGPRQDYRQALNLGLLTTTGVEPFAQADWPNPTLRPVYRLVADSPNLTGFLLPPFSQDSWPNPSPAAPRAVADYQRSTNLGLLTTTGTKPFAQADWPVPRGARPVVADHRAPVNVALTTTAPTPFSQDDWPVPKGHGPRQDYRQQVNLSLLTTTGTKPFLQRDWPNPLLRIPYRLVADAPNIVGALLSPFAQDDWAVPKGAVRSPSGYEQSSNFRLLAFAAPFAQTQWPNPVVSGSRHGLVEPPPNLAAELLPPFGQSSWPVPRGFGPRQDYAQSVNLGLLTTTGTKPFLQRNWPVPKGHPPRPDYLEPTNLGLLTTTGVKPASQTDWPVPRGHPPRQDYQLGFSLGLTVTTPFVQTDWPVPKGYAPRLDYAQQANLGLLTTTGAAPFAQTDWPLPFGYWPKWRLYNDPTGAVLRLRNFHPIPTSVGSEGIAVPNVTGETIAVLGAISESVTIPIASGEGITVANATSENVTMPTTVTKESAG